MSNIFSQTEVLKMPRSMQEYYWTIKSTLDYGKLYPIFAMDCVPGDTIRIMANLNFMAKPMTFPNLTPNKVTMHFFFCPYRLLDDNFTTGVIGTTEKGEAINYDFPKWVKASTATKSKTLWDYLGLPINVKLNESGVLVEDNTSTKGIEPTIYLKRAYNKIFNDMYRNENFVDEVDLDDENLKFRCWRADYFTKSLPWQQKPSDSSYFALPVNTVIGAANYDPAAQFTTIYSENGGEIKTFKSPNIHTWKKNSASTEYGAGAVQKTIDNSGETIGITTHFLNSAGNDTTGYYGNGSATGTTVDLPESQGVTGLHGSEIAKTLSALSTAFDISDLRLAGQMQKWAERNARGGTRYDEMIRAHFGITPRDARLQLPEFIGGFKFPILCGQNYSSVETSGAPQGTRAGIGNGMGGDKIRKYFVEEYGLIMGIISILPQAEYQQGMPREWIKHNQLDFFHHELCCLSEREVFQGELVCSNDSTETDDTARYNKLTFGFQGIYNEYRYHPNVVTGEARLGELANWHQSRIMDPSYTKDADNKIVPATVLGEDFVEAKDVRKSPFADLKNTDPFILTGHFGVKAFRPMTYRAEPGLFDHF